MYTQPDFGALTKRFDAPGVIAIALFGSFARGDAGYFSDIDLTRFIDGGVDAPQSDAESFLIEGRLVTVHTVKAGEVEDWFTRPELAVKVIAGLRAARPLLDRAGYFDTIQRRALAFTWDTEMQQKANRWASREMVGWIEEALKGLEGLRRNDIGRMLNARFGLTWGLSQVMVVYKGHLLTSDNGIFAEVNTVAGPDSDWVRLRRTAFGIGQPDGRTPCLREQVTAGLHLYIATAELLAPVLDPHDADMINQTVGLIKTEIMINNPES